MLHKTRAIVLRTVPYGETSLIVLAYTESFGLQSYIVKGAKKVTKKASNPSLYLQPAALLELVVYHNELKQLQIIKEMKWSLVYNQVFTDVTRYAVALFAVELLSKCIRQAESNAELFGFVESYLHILDETPVAVAANLPLHFLLHLAAKLGFQLEDNYDVTRPVLDLQEGRFAPGYPQHQLYLDGKLGDYTIELLRTINPVTLYRLKLNKGVRRQLLEAYLRFYEYHISDFGRMKSVKVLEELLG